MLKHDIETVRSLISYDAVTGELIWKHRPVELFHRTQDHLMWNKKHAGKIALGYLNKKTGHLSGRIFYKPILAHVAAWCIHYGAEPLYEIDHIDGNGSNNSIVNLRDVSHANNMRNLGLGKRNKSGVVGVHFDITRHKWAATIRVNGATIGLGRFCNFNDAVVARNAAELKHNFHENHGKRKSHAISK